MPREVQINTTVDNKQAVTSISTLKKAFQQLNKELDKHGKDGALKLKIDLDGIDATLFREITKGLEQFSKSMKEIESSGKILRITNKNISHHVDKTKNDYRTYNKEINKTINNHKVYNKVLNETSKNQKAVGDELLSTLASWTLAQRVISQTIGAYSQLTDATYGVGIAGRMNLSQIGELNKSFIELSTTVPQSAKGLAQAVDGLIRTGRSYDDARKIIKEVANLSVASGDDLKSTAELVTKVMVSLGVSGDYVEQTLNTMHSTAIQTASDMSYLAGAFKSVAGASSVLVASSGYAGKELDEYKQKVLSTNMAMIGALANTGLSASEAGTKIKNLVNGMLLATPTAQKLFNTVMKLNSVKNDKGGIFNYSDLSKIAKQDYNKAIEKLSELRKQGVLTDEAMGKIFTTRHGLDLANLLDQVNGDVKTFVKNLSEGYSYLDDTAKNMFNINNQVKQFQNNSLALAKTQLQTVNDVGTGGLMAINGMMKSLSESLDSIPKSISSTFGVLSTSLVTSVAGVTTIHTIGKLLLPLFTGVGSVLGAWVLPITAVVAGVSFLIKQSYDLKKSFFDISEAIKDTPNSAKALQREVDSLTLKIDKTKELMKEATNPNLDGVSNFNAIMDMIVSKSKTLKEYLDSSANADFGYNYKKTIDDIKLLSEDIEEVQKKINSVKFSNVSDVEKSALGKVGAEKSKLFEYIRKYNRGGLEDQIAQYETSEKILKLFFKFNNEKVPIDKIASKIQSELKGVQEVDIQKTISRYVNLEDLEQAKQVMGELGKDLDTLNNKYVAMTDSAEKQAKANIKAMNQLKALQSETLYNELLKTGSTTVNGELISGFEAILKITDDYLSADYTKAIDSKKDEISKLKDLIIETTDKAKEQNRELTQAELDSIQATRDKIDALEKQKKSLDGMMSTLKNNGGSIAKELKALFEGVDITAQNLESILQISALILNRDYVKDEDTKKVLQDIINRNVNIVKHEDQQRKARQANNTKYQLKHISYLKENLQLELEIAKIGASKEKQAYLEYEYKLKTLEANKQLASQEKKNVLDMVRDYRAESGIGSQYLSKALKASSASEIQQLLNEFESKHSGIMIGDSGKRIKSDYDQIVKIMKATKQVEDAGTKFKVEIQKGISSIQNAMSSEIFATLSENSAQFRRQYLESLAKEFTSRKNKIGVDFGLGENYNLQDELLKSTQKIDLLKAIGVNPSNIQQFKEQFVKLFDEATYEAVINSEEKLSLLFSNEENLMSALVQLEKERLNYNNKVTDNVVKQLEAISSISSLFSKMGDVFGVEIFGDVGNALNAFKDAQSFISDPKNDFSLSGVFNPKAFSEAMENGMERINWDKFSDNLSKAFENMTKGLGQGSAIGALVGNITGGGQSSQMAGGLAGLITGAMGVGGLTGVGIQVGASLLGGFFDKGNKDQERAERRTKEANKIYNKNTEALQKLSQNMANLNGGVDGLNNALISSFSKIPTVGNLNRVTDAMSQLYKTMDKTRIFNEVAYQVTKTKKGKKGFLGIGGSAGTSWTETIKLSVQEMLNRYGFKGTIHDMTSQQIRDFSKWLEDYDLGDSDNFSVLADALENYAEALDKMEKNVEKFFYDSTMESFEGISSLQQEELRQQIEDFYKNLGLQIDEETSKEIDKLAEQMSVMVTIMQDVRGNFIKSWKDSGLDAGKAFVTSMQPYVEAMLTNISQIYYDVYFSDVNKQLEDEFKALSEKLVELKKKGGELNWSSVADELSGSFEKVIAVINSTKNETESFNTILLQLQKQAMESGLSLSEIFDLGLVTGTQKTVIESFKDALSSNEADSAFKSIGNMVGEKVGEALVNKMIDSVMGDKIFEMSAQLDKVLSGNLSFDSLAGLANDAMSVGTMLEQQRLRFEAIRSMFDFSGDITYENQNSNIQYESGTSQSIVNNYYLSSNIDAGNIIEADSVERLADELLDIMIEKLRVDKGIDLTK